MTPVEPLFLYSINRSTICWLTLSMTSLGAPSGKTMCMFIDDLNMPALDKYGSQPPVELLRQVIDQGGFYDRQKLFFKYVANCTFAAACAPPGGGR
jgi:dynein heavy chain